MYGKLGSVKGLVDLAPEYALDEAEAFLASLGYTILRRTSTTLTAERHSPDQPAGQDVPNLTVVAMPQPQGGVQIKIRGNDVEGVQARQADWIGWSEGLPKKAAGEADAPTDEQGGGSPDVDLPPPPTVESLKLPPPASTTDVPVPPLPQQRSWETAAPPPQRVAPQEGWRQRHPLLTGLLAIIVLLFVLNIVTSAFGNGGGGSGNAGDGGGGGGKVEDEGSGETFTRENYGELVANPYEHVGAKVDITGQLLDNPESQGNEVAFQMWADPIKIDWSTIVHTDRSALKFGTDDYVHVTGTVLGEMEGENAFGGTVSAVELEADNVERVDAMAAVDPTQETVEVEQTRGSEGFSVTLKKVEFGTKHTRVYLTARNDSAKSAKFDFYASKIIQGGDRAGQNDPFDYNLPKPKTGLRPGEETEGAVIFGRADPSQPLQVSFAWQHGGFMAPKPDPLVFAVAP